MDEATWLSSSDPAAMLKLIIGNDANVAEGLGGQIIATDRKLRLFACACCRQVWGRLDEQSRNAVESLEAEADGKKETYHASRIVAGRNMSIDFHKRYAGKELTFDIRAQWNAADAVAILCDTIGPSPNERDLRSMLNCLERSEAFASGEHPGMTPGQTPKWACHLLRLIFGNPFRGYNVQKGALVWYDPEEGEPMVDSHWQDWLTPDVLSTVQACYDLRDATAFIPLWDQLETAGCTSEEIRHALAWERRCADCLGTGVVTYDTGGTTPWGEWVSESGPCDCNSGWWPIPGEPFCVRGFWVVDTILGLS